MKHSNFKTRFLVQSFHEWFWSPIYQNCTSKLSPVVVKHCLCYFCVTKMPNCRQSLNSTPEGRTYLPRKFWFCVSWYWHKYNSKNHNFKKSYPVLSWSRSSSKYSSTSVISTFLHAFFLFLARRDFFRGTLVSIFSFFYLRL